MATKQSVSKFTTSQFKTRSLSKLSLTNLNEIVLPVVVPFKNMFRLNTVHGVPCVHQHFRKADGPIIAEFFRRFTHNPADIFRYFTVMIFLSTRSENLKMVSFEILKPLYYLVA